MKIANIDRLLLFREDEHGRQLTMSELQKEFGFEPDGTNAYYGVNDENVHGFKTSGKALSPKHRALFDDVQGALRASSSDEKTVMLGVEPSQAPEPYGFVAANMDLIRQLARELDAEQQTARSAGKRLNISIRYSSEMNDGAQIQGHNPAKYISTHVEIRTAFKQLAPGVLFSFSPALRADLPESLIAQYWPGDAYVDIVGGTWYIGSPEQRAASLENMIAYLLHRIGSGRPFALSEVGGCDASDAGNDGALSDMLHELEALQLRGISFKYVTLFLASKWGADVTLAFLDAGTTATA